MDNGENPTTSDTDPYVNDESKEEPHASVQGLAEKYPEQENHAAAALLLLSKSPKESGLDGKNKGRKVQTDNEFFIGLSTEKANIVSTVD